MHVGSGTTGLIVLTLVLALLTPAVPAWSHTLDAACPTGLPAGGFTDATGSVHRQAIDCIVGWDLARGVAAGQYAPAQQVTRAQMASFVARLIAHAGGSLPPASSQGFTDIAGNVHADRINQLAEVGVVQGTSATTYDPSAGVRRDQMATFLVRAFEHLTDAPLPGSPGAFSDIDGNVHEDNIGRAAAAGFTGGTGEGRYSPAEGVRRDQMAAFLARTLDRLVRDGHATLPDWPERTWDVTLPGVRFDLPGDPGQWDARPPDPDDYTADYRGAAVLTNLSVRIGGPLGIDETLAEQAAFFEEHGYEVTDPWHVEVWIAGADRAVTYTYVTPSGDSFISILMLEAGGVPVVFDYSIYIEDLDHAPSHEQWLATVQSVHVDAAALP